MALSGNSRFAYAPTDVSVGRSRLMRNFSNKFTANVGELVPFFVDEILPGDTVDLSTAKVIRLQTLLTPMMDNLYAEIFYFFVPARLTWSHWKEFMGENTTSAWIPAVDYTIPQVTAPEGGWNIGTLADYFGMPTGVSGISMDARYARAYALCVNEWFRDQNLQNPVSISLGDADIVGSNGDNYITDLVKCGKPFIANKFHDYFTSGLPSPQKGPDVDIDLGGYADVLVGSDRDKNFTINNSGLPLHFYETYTSGSSRVYSAPANATGVRLNGSTGALVDDSSMDTGSSGGVVRGLVPSNLYADLSAISAFSINDLRLAFAVQRWYERSARSGSRYVEVLKSFFGVTSPDYRLQRPEYLGGNRIPININQVIQQSESTASSPLANTAAMSLTSDSHHDFVRSFTEHGILLGLCCMRYDHTYQQGIPKMFSRKTKFDFYWPQFAKLGEMPIYLREIYAQGTDDDDDVFAYQEAFAEYRYRPNTVCGEMRSAATASLDVWHLADDYSSAPSLSPTWIQEDKANVDRVLAVTSSVSNQYFADFYFKYKHTRPMPVYSIPGLIDHF